MHTESNKDRSGGSLDRLVSLPLRDIAAESDALIDEIDKHYRLAAEVRSLIHNGGAGPNLAQLKRCDSILREIGGLPPAQANDQGSVTGAVWRVQVLCSWRDTRYLFAASNG